MKRLETLYRVIKTRFGGYRSPSASEAAITVSEQHDAVMRFIQKKQRLPNPSDGDIFDSLVVYFFYIAKIDKRTKTVMTHVKMQASINSGNFA